MPKLNLVILGGGNASHCYAGLASSLPDVEVRVLSLYQDEAERWNNAMKTEPFEITFVDWEPGKEKIFKNKPALVTKDPSKAIPGAHLIVFVVPSFAHGQYFDAMEPFLEEGMIICGSPGGGGFMFQALHTLKNKAKKCCLMSFETLPWACRLTQFGRSATILAVKDVMSGGAMGDYTKKTVLGKTPQETFEYTLLGKTKTPLVGHLLGDTLASGNTYVHPCIEYSRWKDWDGKPLDEPPDFYHGVSELGASMVQKASDECLAIRDAINKQRPDVNLTQVIGVYNLCCTIYSDDVTPDKTNLYTIFHSCKGYTGIKHPMVKTADGKYVPDFKHRYFTEDIPFGQVVVKGIAEIVGVKTPTIDTIINWAQQKMGKEYIVGDKLIGKDLGETRCPQRFGIKTLKGILDEE